MGLILSESSQTPALPWRTRIDSAITPVYNERMNTPEVVVQASIDAYNAHDLDGYMACFIPAATFGQLGGRILLDSREAMRGFYGQFFAERPTVHCTIRSRSTMGPFVIDLQEIGSPELAGEAQAPMQAMVISEVREGRIAKIWYAPLSGGSPAH